MRHHESHLPVSIVILVKSAPYIQWNAFAVAIVISGIFLMLANFKAAHMVMHYVNKRADSAAGKIRVRKTYSKLT